MPHLCSQLRGSFHHHRPIERSDCIATIEDFFRLSRTSVESVAPRQAQIARQAYRDFGKGRHKAGLNFGDCFAYALAKDLDEPLLFKGRDFGDTDIEPAEY